MLHCVFDYDCHGLAIILELLRDGKPGSVSVMALGSCVGGEDSGHSATLPRTEVYSDCGSGYLQLLTICLTSLGAIQKPFCNPEELQPILLLL